MRERPLRAAKRGSAWLAALSCACAAALLLLSWTAADGQQIVNGSWSFVTNRGLRAPAIEVTLGGQGSAEQAPGDLFLAPIKNYSHTGGFIGMPGPEIVEAGGNLVWEHPLGRAVKVNGHVQHIVAMDFHADSYQGRPVLVWWEGYITPQGFGNGFWAIVDQHYKTIALIRAPRGYELDFHDIQFTPQGAAYILVSRVVKLNLHCCGGPADGAVEDQEVLEVDPKSGRILWRWDPLRHVPLRDAYTQPPRTGTWDPYHLNSIGFSPTGEPIISARNTWAAYWVAPQSGRVLATLGGKRSSFALGPGVRFAWQHDVRQQQAEQVSLFDDEAAPAVGRQSRALLVTLDFTHRTATLTREYLLPTPALAGSQGNAQLLASGNLLVGWGQLPYLSEYSSSGQLVYLASLPGPDESYRAFRSPWIGLPTGRPALALDSSDVLHASWNGATQIASWQLLAGDSENSLVPTGPPVPRQGFETQLTPASAAAYYAVRALDSSGATLATSPTINAAQPRATGARNKAAR